MASLDTSRAAYNAVGFAERIGEFVADAMGNFAAWNDVRATRNALSRLSDRELEDIGLCRGDIESVARRR